MRLILILLAILIPFAGHTQDANRIFWATGFGAKCDGHTDDHAAINAAIAAASRFASDTVVGGTVWLPGGRCYIDGSASSLRMLPNVELRGMGVGRTVIVYGEPQSGSMKPGIWGDPSNVSPAPERLHSMTLRDFTIEGQHNTAVWPKEQAYTVPPPVKDGRRWQPLIYFDRAENLVIDNVEARYGGSTGIGVYRSRDVVLTNNKIYDVIGDGIDCWDTSDCNISGNRIQYTGDDSIAAHSGDTESPPIRAGLIISNNQITDAQGIKVLGPKAAIISGNIVRRGLGFCIAAFADRVFQGDTPNFALRITNNVCEDIYQRRDRNMEQYYIAVGGAARQPGPAHREKGAASQAPGRSISATRDTWYLPSVWADYNANTKTPRLNPEASPASPGSFGVVVANNTLLRTLPGDVSIAAWGYGVPPFGAVAIDGNQAKMGGVVTEQMLSTPGILLLPGLRHALIADNAITLEGAPYGIGIPGESKPPNAVVGPGGTRYSVADMDYEDVVVRGNDISGVESGGFYNGLPQPTNQRLVLEGNHVDCDPNFKSPGRTQSGAGTPGTWRANVPQAFYLYTMSGVTLIGNTIRNCAAAVDASARVTALNNIIFAQPVSVGFPTKSGPGSAGLNGGVGLIPSPGADWTIVFENTDPTSPPGKPYGQVMESPMATAASQPTSGSWVEGYFLKNAHPVVRSPGIILLGWMRLTTGSSNGAADWTPVYGAAHP